MPYFIVHVLSVVVTFVSLVHTASVSTSMEIPRQDKDFMI